MKRFVQDLQSTTPFINSDFHDILQDQHLISYRAYLDGLNDADDNDMNRGIIIKGCELSNVTITEQGYQYRIDFTDSLVYFDGNFYTPIPNIIETPIIDISNDKFYIIPTTTPITRIFRSGLTQSFSNDYLFDYSQTIPDNGSYIEFSFGGTSRRLSRLLRYNSSNSGDIYMSYDAKIDTINNLQRWRDFDNNGLGRNEMKGFQVATAMSGRFPVGYGGEFNYNQLGNTGGTMSLTFSLSQLPTHCHGADTEVQTSKPSNMDHSHPFHATSIFIRGRLFANGGVNSGSVDIKDEVDYNYSFRTDSITMGVKGPNTTQTFYTRSTPLATQYPYMPILMNGTSIWHNLYNQVTPSKTQNYRNFYINAKDEVWGPDDILEEGQGDNQVVDQNTEIDVYYEGYRQEKPKPDIAYHVHRISEVGQNIPHENRPPYQVVLYYYKI